MHVFFILFEYRCSIQQTNSFTKYFNNKNMKTTFKEEPLYINTADRIKSINLVLGSQLKNEDVEIMLKEYYSYHLLKLLNEALEKSYEDVAYHFFASSKYIVDSLQHDYSFVQQTCKRLERLEEWIDKLYSTLLKLIKNTEFVEIIRGNQLPIYTETFSGYTYLKPYLVIDVSYFPERVINDLVTILRSAFEDETLFPISLSEHKNEIIIAGPF